MRCGEVEEGRILDMHGGSILMHNGEGYPLAKGSVYWSGAFNAQWWGQRQHMQ